MPSTAKPSTAKTSTAKTSTAKTLADFQDVIEEVITEEHQEEHQEEHADDADDEEEEMSRDDEGEVVPEKKRRKTKNPRPRGRKTLERLERDEDDACIRRNLAQYKVETTESRLRMLQKIPSIIKTVNDGITAFREVDDDDIKAIEAIRVDLTVQALR